MSPFEKPIILDNDVVSRLYTSGALRRVLAVWPKRIFHITEQVLDEAKKWRAHGQELVGLLEDLMAEGTLVFTSIDDSSEEEIWAYAKLQLESKLGRGESASITIAHYRGFDFVTDDGTAKDVCSSVCPGVSLFGTGDLLNMAVRDGLMSQSEVNSIQAAIRRRNEP